MKPKIETKQESRTETLKIWNREKIVDTIRKIPRDMADGKHGLGKHLQWKILNQQNSLNTVKCMTQEMADRKFGVSCWSCSKKSEGGGFGRCGDTIKDMVLQ